jgi:hypothetical protein
MPSKLDINTYSDVSRSTLSSKRMQTPKTKKPREEYEIIAAPTVFASERRVRDLRLTILGKKMSMCSAGSHVGRMWVPLDVMRKNSIPTFQYQNPERHTMKTKLCRHSPAPLVEKHGTSDKDTKLAPPQPTQAQSSCSDGQNLANPSKF